MRVRIHRGAHEIGGNCVELEAAGKRLVVDLGRPLDAPRDEFVPLPDIPGLAGPDPSLVGVVISHGHPDHHGLAHLLHEEVPIYMGSPAYKVLDAATFFTGAERLPEPTRFLCDREPLDLEPFRVTPYLADHSAFDAYSLLVEAGGRRLFYSGDLRAHGRKARVFERLVAGPPQGVDVLIMEGTHVSEDSGSESALRTELDVEEACVDLFRSTNGMVLVQYSPQNIDRLVTLFRAAARSGRQFVMDLYAATIAAATGRRTIPHAEWERVRVYLPQSQRRKVIEAKEFERTDRVKTARVYPDELAARPGDFVMTFRQSMARELDKAECLAGAHAVWSLWAGYLEESSGQKTRRWLAERGIQMTVEHASGHASIRDLQRLVEALAPDRVVPIHSSAPDRFFDFFPRVESRPDGSWWEV